MGEGTTATKGQQNRKQIRQEIERSLSEYCPNAYNRMSNLIAYKFNLAPDTLKYSYLPVFLDAGILEYNNDNMLVLTPKGQQLQTTADGLTEEQLKEEYEEEVENRTKLGKPKITFEEYKKTRPKRLKPLTK